MRDETAQLRVGLEDRDVEWEDMSIPDINVSVTLWYSKYGPCTAIEGSNDVPDGTLGVSAYLTAEQAIDATLGPRACRNDAKPMAQQENDRLKAENEKLISVLHEVEAEAVDAYLCLQHDCELLAGELDDRFRKCWHEQDQNEKLRELVRDMWRFTGTACKKYPRLFDPVAPGGQMVQLNAIDDFEQRMRELGIEVDE